MCVYGISVVIGHWLIGTYVELLKLISNDRCRRCLDEEEVEVETSQFRGRQKHLWSPLFSDIDELQDGIKLYTCYMAKRLY